MDVMAGCPRLKRASWRWLPALVRRVEDSGKDGRRTQHNMLLPPDTIVVCTPLRNKKGNRTAVLLHWTADAGQRDG